MSFFRNKDNIVGIIVITLVVLLSEKVFFKDQGLNLDLAFSLISTAIVLVIVFNARKIKKTESEKEKNRALNKIILLSVVYVIYSIFSNVFFKI